MSSVGAFDAKTNLSKLLERVVRGETITITRHGIPIAKLVPAGFSATTDSASTVEDLIGYSKAQGRSLEGVAPRDLIEEGRRR